MVLTLTLGWLATGRELRAELPGSWDWFLYCPYLRMQGRDGVRFGMGMTSRV